jgi:amidase
VPIVVEDLFYTTDAPTGAGTTIYKDFMAPYDATAVSRLRKAGAVILGKVKTSEAALFTHHPSIAAPVNPWNAYRWAGISSSGSGVATAAGMCFGALSSDTGGSIRLPSSCNGITGLKPTYGRVSRHGLFPLAESLDHVGPMARSAADVAALLQVIAGPDDNDATALRAPVPNYLGNPPSRLGGFYIGVDPDFESNPLFHPPVKKALADAVAAFRSLGAKIVSLPLPSPRAVLEYDVLRIHAEAAKAHAATFPSRSSEYGPNARAFLTLGQSVKEDDLLKAKAASDAYRYEFLMQFADVHLILMPVLPIVTPAKEIFTSERAQRAASAISPYNLTLDIAGVPSLTVPGGVDPDGVSIGFQIVGNLLDEERVLEAGHAFQSITDWHMRHPAF